MLEKIRVLFDDWTNKKMLMMKNKNRYRKYQQINF